MDTDVRQLLRDLRSALLGSASSSEEVRVVLSDLRRAGLSLFLVADDGGEDDAEAIPVVLANRDDGEKQPVFRIDRQDLTILRSLGIDPTRKLRRRRR